jgi:hypothetical protein
MKDFEAGAVADGMAAIRAAAMMADKHPILIDLMGICAGMTHASREGRQVALGYIKNILKRERIPIDSILPEFANILAINYEGAKA